MLGAEFQTFKVCLHNSNCSLSNVRKLLGRLQEFLRVLLDERSVEFTFLELGVSQDTLKEFDVGGKTNDLVILKGLVHSLDCVGASRCVHDQF